MANPLLNGSPFPYCPGCGHTLIAKALDESLKELQLDPLNVVMVSDIGCCGLIDALVNCHTVHGLHGRSTALAQGIAMALAGSGDKVIAVIGDGGASIGLQHILTAARWNVDMTVIVHNNLVYGMTGGQPSAFSPPILQTENAPPPMDVCALAATVDAARVIRLFADEDLKGAFIEALRTNGFSLVEVIENCPSHGVRKLAELRQIADYTSFDRRGSHAAFRPVVRQTSSLLDEIPLVSADFCSTLEEPLQITVAGSAGEGVQAAGEIAALAAMRCGLYVEKRGEYPITVGNGFSLAHITLSPKPILYSDALAPDVILAVSAEGMRKVESRVQHHTRLIADEGIETDKHPTERTAFRRIAGAKGAALTAFVYWGETTKVIPLEAFEAAVSSHRLAEKVTIFLEKVRREWFPKPKTRDE